MHLPGTDICVHSLFLLFGRVDSTLADNQSPSFNIKQHAQLTSISTQCHLIAAALFFWPIRFIIFIEKLNLLIESRPTNVPNRIEAPHVLQTLPFSLFKETVALIPSNVAGPELSRTLLSLSSDTISQILSCSLSANYSNVASNIFEQSFR